MFERFNPDLREWGQGRETVKFAWLGVEIPIFRKFREPTNRQITQLGFSTLQRCAMGLVGNTRGSPGHAGVEK